MLGSFVRCARAFAAVVLGALQPFVRHTRNVDASHALEELRAGMRRSSDLRQCATSSPVRGETMAHMTRRWSLLAPLWVVLGIWAAPLAAQTYPSKPVRVVLSSPGGGTDIVARLVAENMSRALGTPFFVESRQPNVAAATFVARAAPDGHTLLVATASYLVNTLLRQPQYDALRDFSPVTLLGTTPMILVVHPALPVNSLRDLIALAKRRPGELNFASGGVSSPLHLAGELFNQAAGVSIVHVPFKGTANASTDVQAGRVQVIFPSTISVAPLIKSGRLKVLAIMSEQRSSELPNVPT